VIASAINDYKWRFLRYEITVPIFAPLISRVIIEALETQVVKGSKILHETLRKYFTAAWKFGFFSLAFCQWLRSRSSSPSFLHEVKFAVDFRRCKGRPNARRLIRANPKRTFVDKIKINSQCTKDERGKSGCAQHREDGLEKLSAGKIEQIIAERERREFECMRRVHAKRMK